MARQSALYLVRRLDTDGTSGWTTSGSRSTARRTWGSCLRTRRAAPKAVLRSPDRLGDYLRSLVAYAELILRGVRLLLDYGAGGHINANVSVGGTAPLQFPILRRGGADAALLPDQASVGGERGGEEAGP
ncbi:hypothetical protein DL767_006414 [Monosporascus sp. MG133]|nr:hypothetical protein DL767_006414 [Monosporascus sp. MG133]